MDNAQDKALETAQELKAAKVKHGQKVSRYKIRTGKGSGLFLEVREGRLKRFIYRFRLGSVQAFHVLGTFNADQPQGDRASGQGIGLSDAKSRHAEAVELVRQGIDPRYYQRQTKAENEVMPLLGEYFTEWLSHKSTATGRKKNADGTAKKLISERTAKDYRSIYTNHIESTFAKRRLCDISRDEIFAHCQKMQRSPKAGPEAIRKTLVILTQVFEQALDAGIIGDNPAATLKPAKFQAQQGEARERWLPKHELRLLWRALDEATQPQTSQTDNGWLLASSVILSESLANAIKLIILTGCRRGEVVGMEWQHIEGDRWTIPQTKNGRAHVVTLCPLTLDILKQQKASNSEHCRFVFESSSAKLNPITGDAVTRALTRLQQRRLAELEPFSVHDLRRSVANNCGIELRANLIDVEALLNHQINDKLLRTYQGAALRDPERIRALFMSWGCFIESNIANDAPPEPGAEAGSNVVRVLFGAR